MFGGYRWHQVGAVLDRINEPAHSPVEYRTAGMGYRPESFRSWFTEKLNHSLDRGGGAWGEAFRIYDLLFNTLPDDFLVKVDRASMAHSVEVRSPFLDHRLVEFAQRVPTRWKAGSNGTKILMRELVDGRLPESIVKRRKQGFEPRSCTGSRTRPTSAGRAAVWRYCETSTRHCTTSTIRRRCATREDTPSI